MSHPRSQFLTTYNSSYIQIGPIRTHYIKKGSGPPLLLIHGGGTWAYTWRNNITDLAEHFTVYAVDMPGFGLSKVGTRFKPAEDYFADFIKAFLDALDIKTTYIVGSSWGGGWVLRFTEKYAGYVKKLVVISSAGLYYHKLKRPTFFWNLINIPGAGRLVSRYFVWPAILTAQYKSLVVDQTKIGKDVGKELAIGLANTDNRRILYEYGYRDMWRQTDKALPAIQRPVLIIWGDQDPMLPAGDAYELQKRIPQAKLAILSQAGHLPHEERPERVNELIYHFIIGKS